MECKRFRHGRDKIQVNSLLIYQINYSEKSQNQTNSV